jgi:hypothetical protein
MICFPHRSQVSLRTLGQTHAIRQEALFARRTGEGMGREDGTGKLEGGKEGGKGGKDGTVSPGRAVTEAGHRGPKP